MKLKEKLAEESAKEFEDARKKLFPMLDPNSFTNETIFIQLGYLKGFEKAKAMAIALAIKWNKKDFDKLKGSTYVHDNFPSQRISFTAELKNLGEEEV